MKKLASIFAVCCLAIGLTDASEIKAAVEYYDVAK